MRADWELTMVMYQINDETKARVIDLIKKLNHRARILESKYSRVDVKELVNTGLFDLEKAQSGYGWLQDLHAMTVREVSFPMPLITLTT